MDEKNDIKILRLSKTIILDWYDGIVTAVIQFVDNENWYLVNLIAWDLNERGRIYSLQELKADDYVGIISFFKNQKPSWPIWRLDMLENEDFEMLEKSLLEIRKNSINVYVFFTSDFSNGISNLRETSVREFPGSIDQIMNLSRKELEYWYGLFR